ncbi:WhiB family transcriptional regulator [Streptomyces sp. NPDC090080]|uniref:WhiB family transcriptional regulator n=1 Tax=Streptomyces sp. NPDC090080 TaxID=3365939 RepID=UPI0037FA7E32
MAKPTLVPLLSTWEWQQQAACRGMNSAVFFSPSGERGDAKRQREDEARAICMDCPVLAPCRQMALAQREAYGVWGGLSAEERARTGRHFARPLQSATH